MLNPIDSFFQYFVKRTFSICCFFSKKNALHKDKGQMLFYIMFNFHNLPLVQGINDHGLKFDYPRSNLFSKGVDKVLQKISLHILQKILYL